MRKFSKYSTYNLGKLFSKTDKQKDRQTDIQTNRQTYRQREILTDRQKQRQTDRQTDRQNLVNLRVSHNCLREYEFSSSSTWTAWTNLTPWLAMGGRPATDIRWPATSIEWIGQLVAMGGIASWYQSVDGPTAINWLVWHATSKGWIGQLLASFRVIQA